MIAVETAETADLTDEQLRAKIKDARASQSWHEMRGSTAGWREACDFSDLARRLDSVLARREAAAASASVSA